MKIDGKTSRIDVKENCLHFYLNGTYIGMLTYEGELSDFRAVIRKKMKLVPDPSKLHCAMRAGLSIMLSHYLTEQTNFVVADAKKEEKVTIEYFEPSLEATSLGVIERGYV